MSAVARRPAAREAGSVGHCALGGPGYLGENRERQGELGSRARMRPDCEAGPDCPRSTSHSPGPLA